MQDSGVRVVLEEKDVAWVNCPDHKGQLASAKGDWDALFQPAAVSNFRRSGGSGFATHPVDDVRRACMYCGVGGWG